MRLTVFLFSFTLILSAFLLFSVQPMFSKMILPLLGGSPSVWNTAMVFFQAILLAGYAYAHGTSRKLGIKTQSAIHLAILLGCAAFLPFAIPDNAAPSAEGNPAFWQLGLMTAIIGAPFFIVSASAPILQRWFAATDHPDADNPYFLYAASNFGSMAALISYPVLVEPLLPLHQQTASWAIGYGVLAVLTLACAITAWGRNKGVARSDPVKTPAPTLKLKAFWLFLAFIPSSLMLGVTTYITTDLASVPMLWVIPLALYLLTFIIVFARRQIVTTDQAAKFFTVVFLITLFFIASTLFASKAFMFLMHLVLFFAAALLCHRKLSDLRPGADHLTSFYMYMSIGGVLGGLFNALLAPGLFVVPFEYALVLCLALVVRMICVASPGENLLRMPDFRQIKRNQFLIFIGMTFMMLYAWRHPEAKSLALAAGVMIIAFMISITANARIFALFGSMMLLLHSPLIQLNKPHHKLFERNFYGVLRVTDYGQNVRHLFHGTTLHGSQPLIPEDRLVMLSYYHPNGPLGDLFAVIDSKPAPQNIAIMGLGTGSLACYKHDGRSFDFYEIDPNVVKIAENPYLFTYLADCGSPYRVILGDARLQLSHAPDKSYDLIVMDAFSSDNVPMHLITLDALRIYLKKLKPGGIIAVNISNRYLNLEPLMGALSESLGVPVRIRLAVGGSIHKDSPVRYTTSLYAAFSDDPDIISALSKGNKWTSAIKPENFRVWTDDYANIITSLSLVTPPNDRVNTALSPARNPSP